MYATLEDGREIQFTADGSPNIINGIADWVYEGSFHGHLWQSHLVTRMVQRKYSLVMKHFGSLLTLQNSLSSNLTKRSSSSTSCNTT